MGFWEARGGLVTVLHLFMAKTAMFALRQMSSSPGREPRGKLHFPATECLGLGIFESLTVAN
eukprot:368857-Pelagomonas_calceolata.AAC.5